MSQKIKNLLIKIADQLDREGHAALADQVDQSIQELDQPEEFDLEIPEEEKLMLDNVWKSLRDSLGENQVI